jgi:hypothetical protein
VDKKPWEQREDESNAAYARFLAYRNLGPLRTLQKAYEAYQADQPEKNRNKTKKFTQQWANDSTGFGWVDRATAWDVDNFLTKGERTATLYMSAVERYTEILFQFLDQGVQPDDFDSATKSIELLHKLLPGETIGAIIAAREQARRERGE